MGHRDIARRMVSRLDRALGERLVSVVLYGPGARGDTYRAVGQLNLMIVASDLEPGTLERLGPPIRWWLRKGHPWPRLFSRELIRDSLDVYPVEFLDISRHHLVLHGDDPLAGMNVDAANLRLQCERELREKLMRLREGYVECRGLSRPLHRLLAASFASFAPVWRGCLQLLGADVPTRDSEVASALCSRLGLDGAPLEEVALVAAGARAADPSDLFSRYFHQLSETVTRVDRLAATAKGNQP